MLEIICDKLKIKDPLDGHAPTVAKEDNLLDTRQENYINKTIPNQT